MLSLLAALAAMVCAIGRSSSSSSSDTLCSRDTPAAGAGTEYAVCVCHPFAPSHPPTLSPPIESPAMERSSELLGWSSGLNVVGAAFVWEEKDAVEPREAWPSGRTGTSAALGRAGGGGDEGLGVSAAGGVGSL